MKYKFIPVDNDINKAIAFANTLDSNNIQNVQRIKLKPFYIPTKTAIEMLQKNGWAIKGVAEHRSFNRKITSNYVQMQHPDFSILDKNGKTEALASITLANSTNGNSPLNLHLGIFRLICSNGLVQEETAEETYITHTQSNQKQLPELIAKLNSKAMGLSNEINNMKQIKLNAEEINSFALQAASLRFTDALDIDPNAMLKVNRIQDESNDLWTVFNRIQENLTADIVNFNDDIKLNQQLFSLAEQYC